MSESTPHGRSAGGPPCDPSMAHDAVWDAGELGCGELLMGLRLHLSALPPQGVLMITALDPAAPEELPAWCRLTGHHLRRAEHPTYFIQRKD
jgi:tRNA 2-thiouridine synthesizing protein A